MAGVSVPPSVQLIVAGGAREKMRDECFERVSESLHHVFRAKKLHVS